MKRDVQSLREREFDLLIVGGGINGAALAHLAAARGKRVVLLEKNDFGSGTSSKSTKLIHGGLRYLEHFEFDLVAESLRERAVQLKSAPHLVRPLEFLIPVYRGDARPLWKMQLGVWFYDLLSGSRRIKPHRGLSAAQVLALEPALRKEGLLGGITYYDAQMDDARLVLENVLSATSRGAIVANYVEVVDFLKVGGKVTGVKARDAVTGSELTVRARKIVCAGGPWTNEFLKLEDPGAAARVRTTKGVHVVYRGSLTNRAIFASARNDRRVFFIIPWKGNSLIGTTDTDYAGRPDAVASEAADIEYLLGETRRYFPNVPLGQAGIITTFAGLRPLINEEGSPSQVSRRHVIFESSGGVVYVIGGKYTTYRIIALDTLRKIYKEERSGSENYPLYGSGNPAASVKALVSQSGLKEATVQYLWDTYGSKCTRVLDLVRADAALKESLCSCSPAIRAQVVYAIQEEMAVRPEDVIQRRLPLGYLDCPSRNCRREIGRLMPGLSSA